MLMNARQKPKNAKKETDGVCEIGVKKQL